MLLVRETVSISQLRKTKNKYKYNKYFCFSNRDMCSIWFQTYPEGKNVRQRCKFEIKLLYDKKHRMLDLWVKIRKAILHCEVRQLSRIMQWSRLWSVSFSPCEREQHVSQELQHWTVLVLKREGQIAFSWKGHRVQYVTNALRELYGLVAKSKIRFWKA